MSEYTAQVEWQAQPGEDFTRHRYSRRHLLRFDGGVEFAGSSALSSVPLPWSDAAAVDPEEMFVASLASCHMLWFLALAAKAGFTVQRYVDDAVGVMARNAEGRLAMTRVTLRPRVGFAGETPPSPEQLEALHHHAHEECFIANSVRTDVRVEPQP
jgi:organic hydroperoxide reductase OsmC/OhrA